MAAMQRADSMPPMGTAHSALDLAHEPSDPTMAMGKGALVAISEGGKVPRAAFEVEDSTDLDDGTRPHTFNRAVWADILIQVGASGHGVLAAGSSHSLDDYTKAQDSMAADMFVAITIGYGVVTLPGALLDCGWLLGLGLIIVEGALSCFIAVRFLEVPYLVQEGNMERVSDVARVLCPKHCWQMATILVLMAWGFTCSQNIANFSNSVNALRLDAGSGDSALAEFGFAVLSIFLVSSSDVRRLRFFAMLCTRAMYVLLVLVILGSVGRVIALAAGQLQHPLELGNMFRSAPGSIIPGVVKVNIAYGGLTGLPAIVADMANPHHAKQVIKLCYRRITAYYVLLATFGYVGFGTGTRNSWPDSWRDSPDASPWIKWYVVSGFHLCLAIRCVAVFPIIMWPWTREIEGLFRWEQMPEVLLGLPWALRRARRIKKFTPSCLIFCSVVYCQLLQHKLISRGLAVTPNVMNQMVLCPVLCGMAICSYRKAVERRRGRTSSNLSRSSMASSPEPRALGRGQLAFVVVVLPLASLLCLFSIVHMLSDLMGPSHFDALEKS